MYKSDSGSLQEVSKLKESLVSRLAKAKVGEIIPYTELSALINRNVQKEGYPICIQARWRTLERHGILFSPMWNQGLKRLSESEIAQSFGFAIERLHNLSVRELKKLELGVSKPKKLNKIDQVEYYTGLSHLDFLKKSTSFNSIDYIRIQVQKKKVKSKIIIRF